jgi:hypothetical protein
VIQICQIYPQTLKIYMPSTKIRVLLSSWEEKYMFHQNKFILWCRYGTAAGQARPNGLQAFLLNHTRNKRRKILPCFKVNEIQIWNRPMIYCRKVFWIFFLHSQIRRQTFMDASLHILTSTARKDCLIINHISNSLAPLYCNLEC